LGISTLLAWPPLPLFPDGAQGLRICRF
jgi:hypothetical protein